jgi:hypothetical protein
MTPDILVCFPECEQQPCKWNRLPVENEEHSGRVAANQIGTPERARDSTADDFPAQPHCARPHLRHFHVFE